ncbi:MAG TPA: glycosyltransferase family 4 protein [Terriglobia bacterium]|nr:glycosyltransferase family 4 protein [Terriglobia bacterium]
MRILVVTPFMWSGAGKAIVRLAGGLQSLGHSLRVVSSGRSKGFADWPVYVDQLTALKIPYAQIDFFDRAPEVLWPSIERLRHEVKDFGPDVIHAHSGVAAFGAIAGSNLPILATLHSWNPERPSWMNTMDLWALNRCNRVVCVSSSYRDYLLGQGLREETSITIYLGIDANEIRTLAHLPGENRLVDKKYFCYLGRLESRKRQLLLVETLAALPEDWCLMLIGGEGEPGYANKVRERAAEIGVSERLISTGQVENPYPLLRQSRCFVSASADEGLGLSALEAMALRVPVVSTPARGIVDFIQNGKTGLLATAEPGALAEKILYLENEPDLASTLTSASAALIQNTFSWPHTIDQYASLFEEIANEVRL